MASISPTPKLQFFAANGTPLVGGKLYSYAAGTTTPLATYTDEAGLTPNANPVILDSRGEASVWLGSTAYKLRLTTATDVDVWTVDNLNKGDTATLAALAASGGAALVGFIQSGSGAQARTAQDKMRDVVSVFDFMTPTQIAAVKANNYTTVTAAEITTAVQNAITAAAGRTVLIPAGTYRISDTLSYNVPKSFGAFSPGIKLMGDGMTKTFLDHRAANKPLIDIDSATHEISYEAAMGASISELAIINPGSTAGSIGIRVLNGYQVKIDHCYIKNMTSHGIELKNGLYTDDGWNMISITQTWLDACLGWGLKADGAAGRNEGSYTYLREVFFQTCGTYSSAYVPPSGGMIWKGQILAMESCAFANGNENVGLYIPGGAGSAQTAELRNTTFENCKQRSFFCRGLLVFRAINCQAYNNNDYVATTAFEFDASSNAIRQVTIENATIRATSGNNPFTAFKVSGANADLNTFRVRNTNWENFDYTGQTRFDGFQFDNIQNNGELIVETSTSVVFRPKAYIGSGRSVPLRLRGPNNASGSGVASTSGEWVPYELPALGLVVPLTGVLAGTRYWCYLYDNDAVPTIEVTNAASQVTDPTSGYAVKNGDATKYYIGSVFGGGTNDTVATTGLGWLDPLPLPGSVGGQQSYLWSDSTGDLRIKNGSLPTSDTDGTVVGTQT